MLHAQSLIADNKWKQHAIAPTLTKTSQTVKTASMIRDILLIASGQQSAAIPRKCSVLQGPLLGPNGP